MPDLRLTERRVKDLPIPESKPYERYWDTEIVGLGVKVSRSGWKGYIFKSRLNAEVIWGKRLPKCTETTLADMRGLAIEWKAAIRRGVNPFAPAPEDDRPSVLELCRMNLEQKKRQALRPVSESHHRDMEQHTGYIEASRLGSLKAADVAVREAADFLEPYSDRPRLHDRLRWWLHNTFEFAIKKGHLPLNGNPWRYVDKLYRLPSSEDLPRFSDEEIARLGAFLTKAADGRTRYEYSPVWIQFIWFLIHNGTRPNDTRVIEREWIDAVNGQTIVRHPSTKTGSKLIYLSPTSAEQIRALPERNRFLFPGRGSAHLKNYATSFSCMREETGLTKPPYAIRRWFASLGRRVYQGEIKPVQGLVGWETEDMALRYAGDDEQLLETLVMENARVCGRVAAQVREVIHA